MMRDIDYALRGACYEIQKTLEAFFGRCEVTVLENETLTPSDELVIEVQYRTHSAVKKYRHALSRETITASYDLGRWLTQAIPRQIVLEELEESRKYAAEAMNHFKQFPQY